MSVYRIVMEVDEGWLEAIANLTDVDIYEGETCTCISKEKIRD
jgi:hypothetical protein